jgi:glycosyltransferase involved in cell wall biosynthesis
LARRLVVVPSDPLAAYEKAGYGSWLERYYNPAGFFGEVFLLSPLESGEREAHGMTVRGVPERDFREALRDVRPNLVRAYGGYWASDLAVSARIPGVPVVVSVHDRRPEMIHDSVLLADAVLCVAHVVERRVLDLGADPRKVRILPNRVDTRRFAPADSLAPSGAPPIRAGRRILHVGRKSEEKNLDTVIRALARMPQDYGCVFVGRGDPSPYRDLARDQAVEDRCFWVESVPSDDLPAWYRWCDCMCVPSRFEGFGIVFLEAAACGAAIVTADRAPMNEYLVADVSAALVDHHEDPEAVAAAIRRCCEDADYGRRLHSGAVDAARPFDVEIVDELEADLYRDVLEGRLGAPPSWRQQIGWRARRLAAAVRAEAGRLLGHGDRGREVA